MSLSVNLVSPHNEPVMIVGQEFLVLWQKKKNQDFNVPQYSCDCRKQRHTGSRQTIERTQHYHIGCLTNQTVHVQPNPRQDLTSQVGWEHCQDDSLPCLGWLRNALSLPFLYSLFSSFLPHYFLSAEQAFLILCPHGRMKLSTFSFYQPFQGRKSDG